MISSKMRTAVTALAFGLGLAPTMAAQRAGRGPDTNDGLLTNRIWMEVTPQSGLPGIMMTFLSNGTLLQDSCWETYTLSNWKTLAPGKMTWTENGTPISADVVSISTVELVLEVGGRKTKVQRILQAAKVPFICPDVKK